MCIRRQPGGHLLLAQELCRPPPSQDELVVTFTQCYILSALFSLAQHSFEVQETKDGTGVHLWPGRRMCAP